MPLRNLLDSLLTQTLLSRIFCKVKCKLVEVLELPTIFELLLQSWQKSLQFFWAVTPRKKKKFEVNSDTLDSELKTLQRSH